MMTMSVFSWIQQREGVPQPLTSTPAANMEGRNLQVVWRHTLLVPVQRQWNLAHVVKERR